MNLISSLSSALKRTAAYASGTSSYSRRIVCQSKSYLSEPGSGSSANPRFVDINDRYSKRSFFSSDGCGTKKAKVAVIGSGRMGSVS